MRSLPALLFLAATVAVQGADLAGDWIVTIVRYGQPDHTRLRIEPRGGHYMGVLWNDVHLDGVVKGATVAFQCSYEQEKETKPCGNLNLSMSGKEMRGQGTLFDERVEVTAQREEIAKTEPTTHR